MAMYQTGPFQNSEPSHRAFSTRLSIVGRASVRLSVQQLARLRKAPDQHFPLGITVPIAKHSDPQTLAALCAMLAGRRNAARLGANLFNDACGDWAVAAASKSLGRSAFAAVVDKFASDGAWGVSMHVIPHNTPHAVSGTLSLALRSHGPAIGFTNEADALLALAGLLSDANVRGVWFVTSAWLPEQPIERNGELIGESECAAAALAIVRHSEHACGTLCIGPAPPSAADPLTQTLLEKLLVNQSRAVWSRNVGGIGVELEAAPVDLEAASL